MAPLFPTDDVPVLKTIAPLTPVVPALEVDSSRIPLEEEDPAPEVITTLPPVLADDIPATRAIIPPVPLLPEPTVTYIDPPLPPDEDPVPIYDDPLSAAVDTPVLNTR